MRILLLVNPFSSSVTPRGRVVIQKTLSADHDVTVAETSRRGHATRMARGATTDGTDVVVVLGGDGTLNEAANGLAGSACALAPLPGGSTNVFARTLGLPDDPVDATVVLLESLAAGRIEPAGLGVVNGRYFLFHVGVGYDAAVVEQVERRAQLKRWAGHPLFIYAAFDTWLRRYDRSRPRLAVHHADGAIVDDGYFTIVANTNPYTFLGTRPFEVAPEATLDRGLVAVTIRTMRAVPFLTVIGGALMGGGRVARSKRVDYRTDLSELTIQGYGPVPYQVDGDFLGEIDELRFRHEPDAIRLVLPDPDGSDPD
ncbi:MAG: diacylglycerol kinase family protein [Acidimicrobiales bacterium]